MHVKTSNFQRFPFKIDKLESVGEAVRDVCMNVVRVAIHDVCMHGVAGWWLSSLAYLALLMLIMLLCRSNRES